MPPSNTPNTCRTGTSARANATGSTSGSSCWRANRPGPEESLHAGCPVVTSIRTPGDYFPPGSRRRQESGEVVIEFTTLPGTARANDVTVVKSSGFEDLDTAALELGRALEVSTPCGWQRVRRSIVFDVWREPQEEPKQEPRFRGCVVLDAGLTFVSIFPVEGG